MKEMPLRKRNQFSSGKSNLHLFTRV